MTDADGEFLDDPLVPLHREILGSMNEGVVLVAVSDGQIVYANRRFERIFGYGTGELVGQHVAILNAHGAKTPEETAAEIAESLRRSGQWQGEAQNRKKDGTTFWTEATVSTFDHTTLGKVWCSVVQDVSERKLAEKRLKQLGDQSTSDYRYRLLESTRIVPWVADPLTWQFTYVGAQVIDLLGYPREQWYDPDFWVSRLHPEDREKAVSYCLASTRACREYEFEYRMIGAAGQVIWLHDIVSVETVDGTPRQLRGFLLDITARKQAQEAVETMATRLLTAKEDEQRRLARELHDGFNQQLAALSIRLGSFRQRRGVSSDLRRELAAAQDDVVELSKDLQRVARDLHPSVLEHLGLIPALTQHCCEVSEREGIAVHLSDQLGDRSLGPDVGLSLFRIIQESLRNVVQHSQAEEAHVRMEWLPEHLYVSIRDRGIGFDPDRADARGLGLTSMRERVRPFNGTLLIRSQPGAGTEVQVRIPWAR